MDSPGSFTEGQLEEWRGRGEALGKKRNYLHEKLYVKRKCIKRNRQENMNLHTWKKKKKKIYTLKQKLPQPLHFCDVRKNAGVLKHTIANPIKKSWSTLIERSGKGFSLPLALTQDWYAWVQGKSRLILMIRWSRFSGALTCEQALRELWRGEMAK